MSTLGALPSVHLGVLGTSSGASATDVRLRRTQPPAYRRWLSQAEATEYFGVTDRTVRNYVGVLSGHRVRGSRLVRIDRNDLDALLRPIPTAGGGRLG